MPDHQVATVLNRAGKRTGRDNTWTEPRVPTFRNDHGIPVHRPGEQIECDEVNVLQAAKTLGTSRGDSTALNHQGKARGTASLPRRPLGNQAARGGVPQSALPGKSGTESHGILIT
jgi:hypothetical protein